MEAPKRKWPFRRVIIAVVLVLVVAGASYSLYSGYASPSVKCQFVPGNNLYVHIITAAPAYPVAGLGVKGWLFGLCPIGTSGNSTTKPASTMLGNWDFVTNSTGYVSIPSSDLAGWSFTFNVPYEGHIYQFSSPVCGDGTATVELNLPSGSINGSRSGIAPGFGESVDTTHSGTQIIQACNVGDWSGNATIS
jgi:hypothetical protein